MNTQKLRSFFLPKLDKRFFVRLCLVALGAYLIFGFLIRPAWVRGESMEPTYHDGGINFCWRFRYAFSKPRSGDVVMIRYAGEHVMLFKRVVAVAGETVEFRDGQLYVNGVRRAEPYVKTACDWNLPPREVKPGHVYVIGDNRDMPMRYHRFGQTRVDRIAGGPLW